MLVIIMKRLYVILLIWTISNAIRVIDVCQSYRMRSLRFKLSHVKPSAKFYCNYSVLYVLTLSMENSISFSIESILSRRDPPSPLSAIQQLVDKLPAPSSSRGVLEEMPSERDVKNTEAEQTPPKRTGIFRQHQLFGLELEFELKKILSSEEISEICQRLQLSEPQVRTWFQNRRAKWRRKGILGRPEALGKRK